MLYDATVVVRDMELLHPRAKNAFIALAVDLRRQHAKGECPVLFEPFETFRHPYRQAKVLADGASKAPPWGSAHQYGLAVDFVPKIKGVFTWEVPKTTWDILRRSAKTYGLLNDIEWDRAHVEHPVARLGLKSWLG